MALTIIAHDAETGEPIYAPTAEFTCPRCEDLLTRLPNGQAMCGWCDILVGMPPTESEENA